MRTSLKSIWNIIHAKTRSRQAQMAFMERLMWYKMMWIYHKFLFIFSPSSLLSLKNLMSLRYIDGYDEKSHQITANMSGKSVYNRLFCQQREDEKLTLVKSFDSFLCLPPTRAFVSNPRNWMRQKRRRGRRAVKSPKMWSKYDDEDLIIQTQTLVGRWSKFNNQI